MLNAHISALSIGKENIFGNLTVYPLINAEPSAVVDYQLLEDALAEGTVKITEVSEGGQVPELLLDNRGSRPVFILDGEELVGAKQNRVANVTTLAPAQSQLNIPVSCVEAGRWGYDAHDFGTSGNAHFARGRAAKTASVSDSMRSRGGKYSDQDQVWRDIAGKAARMDVHSQTGSMCDMFQRHRQAVEEYVAAMPVFDRQTGAAFSINGRLVGVESFDNGQVFERLLPKIVRSYALDALEEHGPSNSLHTKADSQVPQLLRAIGEAFREEYPGVGIGTDIRFSSPHVFGGALAVGGRIIHLAGFVENPHSGGRLANTAPRRRFVRRGQ